MQRTVKEENQSLIRQCIKDNYKDIIDFAKSYALSQIRKTRRHGIDLDDIGVEISSQALIAAMDKAEELKPGVNPLLWCYGFIRKKTQAYFRDRSRRLKRFSSIDDLTEHDGHHDGRKGQREIESMVMTRSILEQLRPQDREILARHHLMGESVPELAEHYGIKRASASTKLTRARKQARLVVETNTKPENGSV